MVVDGVSVRKVAGRYCVIIEGIVIYHTPIVEYAIDAMCIWLHKMKGTI